MDKYSEDRLSKAINDPDFLALSGSRLYGYSTEQSDYDYRGFVLPPFEYLIGVVKFEVGNLDGDHKVFNVRKFIEMSLNGDPQSTELFFVGDEFVYKKTAFAESILSLRSHIVSNRIYQRILGYGRSEWRKAMGQVYQVEKRTKTEDQIVTDIRSVFCLDKNDMDEIIFILEQNKPVKVENSLKHLGAKRKAEFDKFGFGTSSASHTIRLLSQLEEVLLTGNITFPRPEAQLLSIIRKGEISREEVTEIYEQKLEDAVNARRVSCLRDNPDKVFVWNQYINLVGDKIVLTKRYI